MGVRASEQQQCLIFERNQLILARMRLQGFDHRSRETSTVFALAVDVDRLSQCPPRFVVLSGIPVAAPERSQQLGLRLGELASYVSGQCSRPLVVRRCLLPGRLPLRLRPRRLRIAKRLRSVRAVHRRRLDEVGSDLGGVLRRTVAVELL